MNFLAIALSWNGRVDRTTFLATMGMFTVASVLGHLLIGLLTALAPKLGGALMVLSIPLFGWMGLVLNVKRLRDMGHGAWLAFVPMGLLMAAIVVVIQGVFSAAATNSVGVLIASMLGGGLLVIVSVIVGAGFLLWFSFAASSPAGTGERLLLFSGTYDAASSAAPSAGLASALDAALARQATALPAGAAALAAPRAATISPGAFAARRPGPGGAPATFGRRR